MHTVKRNLARLTLIDFNNWLKEKAEAHERMKTASIRSKVDENAQSGVTKTKTTSNVFAATSSTNEQRTNSKQKSDHLHTNCIACREKHPLWRCQILRRKTTTERAKLIAENKLCFSCLNADHSFGQCPQLRKCTKEGYGSSHNTFLQ